MFTVSASRLKLYTTCRAQYYDKYIRRQPDTLNTSSLFGSALHKAIEYYYTKKRNPQYTFRRYMTCMYDHYTKTKDFTEYEPFSTLIKKGNDILSGFDFNRFAPIENELAFTYDLTDRVRMHGFIDMVTAHGFIVDFKSSKRKPKDLQNDIQFITYVWAYVQKYEALPNKVIWYHLRTNELIEVDAATLYSKIGMVKEIAETLADDTFENLSMCTSCPPWCKVRIV